MSGTVHSQGFQLKLEQTTEALINSTAVKNSAIESEPHYATDSKVLYVFDGTNNVPVGAIQPTETSTGTATVSDFVRIHFCNSASAYTLTLPTNVNGKVVTIINKGAGQVTLSPVSGSISGESTQTIDQNDVFVIHGDGTSWY